MKNKRTVVVVRLFFCIIFAYFVHAILTGHKILYKIALALK